jgi:magnesium chelatase family protein
MAIAKTLGLALSGVAGQVVEIEADLSSGLPGLGFTGLADVSVVEARDRVRAAVLNSGIAWPNRRITVALLPADLRKVGSRFDLAITVAVLAAAGEVPGDAIADVAWIAELGLDGRLRPVRGVLPAVLAASRAGLRRLVVSHANAAEAALARGVDVRYARDLRQVVDFLREAESLPAAEPTAAGSPDVGRPELDLADVAGQAAGKRAVEIAAAGRHHLALFGPPGSGKTMLAERLPGLLPQLDETSALEVTAVHSVAGQLSARASLITQAPFQAPHHTASVPAIVGGGSGIAGPGAISLATHGVLFLDEAPEFDSAALEALRQPLESGHIVLHRGRGVVSYPARFLLVLAANPCPCGNRDVDCSCTPYARRRYQQRLSGPLLDRVDVRVTVTAVSSVALFADAATSESTQAVAARVAAARSAARERWHGTGWQANGDVTGTALRRAPWRLPAAVLSPAQMFLERGQLTARGLDRVLRVAWTLCDLAGRTCPNRDDVGEAVYFRSGRADAWAA